LKRIRTVIVDDEPLARRRIRDLLERYDDIDVAGEAEDGMKAVAEVSRQRPDLLFLDVQMPGMDGFEVLESLDAPRPLIVFTTAYDTYALRAFEVSAVDYLLKPIDEERFHDAIGRVRNHSRSDSTERIAALLARLEHRDKSLRRIVVKEDGRVFFVDVRDVDWFEAAGNYVNVHANRATHLIRTTMSALEDRLDRRTFVRIHRRTIVNVARIHELQARFRGTYAVVLKSGETLELSRAYKEQLGGAIG
jgi:two-component system LytT family response regulator